MTSKRNAWTFENHIRALESRIAELEAEAAAWKLRAAVLRQALLGELREYQP